MVLEFHEFHGIGATSNITLQRWLLGRFVPRVPPTLRWRGQRGPEETQELPKGELLCPWTVLIPWTSAAVDRDRESHGQLGKVERDGGVGVSEWASLRQRSRLSPGTPQPNSAWDSLH